MSFSSLTDKYRITRSDENDSYLNILDDGRKFWIIDGQHDAARKVVDFPSMKAPDYSGDFKSRFSRDVATILLEAEKQHLKDKYPDANLRKVEQPDYTPFLLNSIAIIAWIILIYKMYF